MKCNYSSEEQTFLKLRAARDQAVWTTARGSASSPASLSLRGRSQPVCKTCTVASSKLKGYLARIYALLRQRRYGHSPTLIRIFFSYPSCWFLPGFICWLGGRVGKSDRWSRRPHPRCLRTETSTACISPYKTATGHSSQLSKHGGIRRKAPLQSAFSAGSKDRKLTWCCCCLYTLKPSGSPATGTLKEQTSLSTITVSLIKPAGSENYFDNNLRGGGKVGKRRDAKEWGGCCLPCCSWLTRPAFL